MKRQPAARSKAKEGDSCPARKVVDKGKVHGRQRGPHRDHIERA